MQATNIVFQADVTCCMLAGPSLVLQPGSDQEVGKKISKSSITEE